MVKLKVIVDALEMASDMFEQFVNSQTGEVVFVSSDFRDEDDEELIEEIESSDYYIRLPDQYEINEYNIMKDFANSLEDNFMKNKLLNVLKNRRPYRNFKDEVLYLGIREDYFKFREEVYYEMAKEWCHNNRIEFE